MNTGQLRHLIMIQRPVPGAADAFGQVAETWSTFGTAWASIEPLSTRESWAAQQVQSEATHRVTIRYLAGILPSFRILFGSRILALAAPPRNQQEPPIFTELLCVERTVFPPTLTIAETQAGNATLPSIQSLLLENASGGNWTLSYNGNTTAAIAAGANAAQIQSALVALPTVISAGNLTVTGVQPKTITFSNNGARVLITGNTANVT